MGVFKVWVPSREHLSVQALYDAAIALYWKNSDRQNPTHLTLLKHKNTKTSLYKLSKNHWVIALLENFGSVRRKLQSTVSLFVRWWADYNYVITFGLLGLGWSNIDLNDPASLQSW